MQGCYREGSQLPLLEGTLLNGSSSLFYADSCGSAAPTHLPKIPCANEKFAKGGNWGGGGARGPKSKRCTYDDRGRKRQSLWPEQWWCIIKDSGSIVCFICTHQTVETWSGGDGQSGREEEEGEHIQFVSKTSPYGTLSSISAEVRTGRESLIFPGLLGRGTCWPYCVVPIFLLSLF